MQDETKTNQLNIELKEDVGEGIYSNLALITHSSSEFILDFIRVMPGMPKANVQSRIILTPEHAKRLLFALEDNVRKYEAHMGTIKTSNNPNHGGMPPITFGGPAGEA